MSSEPGLHRSVHPNHMDGLIVGNEAFSPTSEENYKLSVDCEKIWLANQSFIFRTTNLGKQSSGIWTLPREMYARLTLAIEVDIKIDNPAHSLIVFPKNDKARRRDAARRLAALANDAGVVSLLG